MIELVLADKESELRSQFKEDDDLGISALPEFSMQDLTGKGIASQDFAGRVVLVEYWATWCPPCRGTLAWLGELKKRYGDQLTILAIAFESDEPDVREVSKKMNLPIQWAMGTPELARKFGDISAVPTLFLFDSNGATRRIYYGATPDLHETAMKDIESALQAKK
jgi:thiol-disulfide isomerase/thioredoxin